MVGMISLSNPLIAKHGPTEEEGIVYFIRPSSVVGSVNAIPGYAYMMEIRN